jgi:hypothetical protein
MVAEPAEVPTAHRLEKHHSGGLPSSGSPTRDLLCLGSLSLTGLQLQRPAHVCAVLFHQGLYRAGVWVPHPWVAQRDPKVFGHRRSVSGLLINDVASQSMQDPSTSPSPQQSVSIPLVVFSGAPSSRCLPVSWQVGVSESCSSCLLC